LNNDIRKKFGQALFTWRARKMTQTALGKEIGASAGAISSWECGRTFPSLENFDALVKVVPALDKEEYRGEITVGNIAPKKTTPKNIPPQPMNPVKHVRRVACSPESFDKRLYAGKYKSERGARMALTHATHGPLTWDSTEISTAKAHIINHFNPKKQKAAPPAPPPAAAPTPTTAIVPPPRTVLVPFHDFQLEAYKDPDGDGYWLQISSVCDRLVLDAQRQRRKLQSRSWAKVDQKATLRPDGTARVGSPPWYIHSSAVMMWLANINENKVDVTAAEAIIKLQKECANVLDAYFHYGRAVNARNSVLPPDISISQQYALMSEKLVLFAETVSDKMDARFDALLKVVEGNTARQDRLLGLLVQNRDTAIQEAVEVNHESNQGWSMTREGHWQHKDGRRSINESVMRKRLEQNALLLRTMLSYGVQDLPSPNQLCWLARMVGIQREILPRADQKTGEIVMHSTYPDNAECLRLLVEIILVWSYHGGCRISKDKATGKRYFNLKDAEKKLLALNYSATSIPGRISYAQSMEQKAVNH
jgi:transcriptional regulator with XRE-family HTH domain